MNFENYGKPDYYRFKDTYKLGDSEITWYLDSSKKLEILELKFETSDSFDDLTEKNVANEICNWAKGKGLNKLPTSREVSSENIYPLSLLSYKLFLNNINGKVIPFHQQKGERADELICRCFGVYKQEINDFLLNGATEKQTLQTLGQELRSGIGCGSCHKDLRDLLELFGHSDNADENQVELKDWRGLDTKLLANLCSDEIKLFLADKGEGHKLVVVGVQPDKVLIKYSGDWDKEQVSSDVINHFRTYLTPGLTISVIS